MPANNLLEQAKQGDHEAMTALLKSYGPAARAAISGRIPEPLQSVLSEDDVMQQTYADAVVGIAQFSSPCESSFPKWLTTIAERNLQDAIKMLEAEKRGGKGRRCIQPPNQDDSCYDLYQELFVASGSSPSAHVAREEAIHVLKAAIAKLPESYARVVTLYDLEGRPIEEVCRALSRSPGAVFMLRARAHQRLHEIMGRTSDIFPSSS